MRSRARERWRRCGAAALLWCTGAAASLLGVGGALAQGLVFPDDPKSLFTAPGVANVFFQACLRTGAQAEAAVDWALTQGFEPVDSLGGTGYELLESQAGNVLRAPGSEDRLLLVVTHDQRCTVWAHRVSGPQVRLAMAEVMDRLGTSGARVTRDFERNIERASAWRNQTQWRYRALRGSAEFGVSAVTTLSITPATQALNMAPWQAPVGPAPDGLPAR
ncbi:MAG: hypothetical protein ABL900_17765 [Burkholderiaceae bacterium]